MLLATLSDALAKADFAERKKLLDQHLTALDQLLRARSHQAQPFLDEQQPLRAERAHRKHARGDARGRHELRAPNTRQLQRFVRSLVAC